MARLMSPLARRRCFASPVTAGAGGAPG